MLRHTEAATHMNKLPGVQCSPQPRICPPHVEIARPRSVKWLHVPAGLRWTAAEVAKKATLYYGEVLEERSDGEANTYGRP